MKNNPQNQFSSANEVVQWGSCCYVYLQKKNNIETNNYWYRGSHDLVISDVIFYEKSSLDTKKKNTLC